MSNLRERLDQLKKESPYKSDADLLREIYKCLRDHGDTTEKIDDFVRKTKGSFSAMIDEKRDFDLRFVYPLEKALDTTGVYLLEGTGEAMRKNEQRGLRYAAVTDTVGNYKTLIDEGVYLEQDEYQCTLLDYMIENKSRVGFEFFANRNELPLNQFFEYKRIGCCLVPQQHSEEDLVSAMVSVCPPHILEKYLNGYYFAENGVDPNDLDVFTKQNQDYLASMLVHNEAVIKALSNYKTIPLAKANPSVYRGSKPIEGETIFVNYFFNLALNIFELQWGDKEDTSIRSREMMQKAIEINKVAMKAILDLGYSAYRLGENGYVYAEGIICGSIAMVPPNLADPDLVFSPKTMEVYNQLSNQIQAFRDKITQGSRVAIVDGTMRLAKPNSPEFYDFYRLMKTAGIDKMASLDGEYQGKDLLRLPAGEQGPIICKSNPELHDQALNLLSSIDEASESALGEGKAYSFPNLSNRSFYIQENRVTGLVPTEVVIGARYDNLAAFLSHTCLSLPLFPSTDGTVALVAKALKTYGIPKKKAGDVLAQMADYFARIQSKFNRGDERGKASIALASQRALWLDLYKKEILDQF